MARRKCRIETGSRRERHVSGDQDETGGPTRAPTPLPCSGDDDDEDETARRLGELFHGLPGELRADIFAWLLVRPVKWETPHRADCLKRTEMPPHDSIRPTWDSWRDRATLACASRFDGRRGLADQFAGRAVWIDPWRSRWAPPPGNPYICSLCWDARLRPKPFPLPPCSLPCLCARRRDLDVLLVCRRWYDEAGAVFYTRNTLAFASPGECVEFFENLPPRWARVVSKVSLRMLASYDKVPSTAAQELVDMVPYAGGVCGLISAWTLLGQLPALAELELDAIFLTRRETVAVLRRPGPPSHPRVRFTQNRPIDWQERLNQIGSRSQMAAQLHEVRDVVWPSQCYREVIDGDFVRDVARGIKGLRYGWKKKHCRNDRREVEAERERYVSRFPPR